MTGRGDNDPPESTGANTLEDVLAEWYRQVDAGLQPSRERFLEEHPQLADEIREFFANEEFAANLGIELGSASDFTRESGYQALFRDQSLGDYVVEGEIARGGMGIVCRARQKSLNRSVALKVILAGELASPEDRDRFRREAEAAASLDHPNIVPVYEFGEERGHLYLSMKLIEGRSLAELPLPVEGRSRFAAGLMEKVARAVHYAHERGVIHRDLKPGNILVDHRGEPYVSDFGLAKITTDEKSFTHPGLILGTLRYLAPEQVTGSGNTSIATVDVYGLGAILYHLLAGHPPFRGDSPPEILKQVTEEEPPSPSSYNSALQRDIVTVCLKCLSKSPRKRYATALAVAEDLRRFLDGKHVRARPTGVIGRSTRWVRRRPFATAALILLFVLLSLTTGLYIGYDLEVRRRAAEVEALARLQHHQLYASRMKLSLGALANLESPSVHEHLDAYIPETEGEDLRGFEWYYLWGLVHREEKTVGLGHAGAGLEFLDEGRTLAVGLEGGGLRLWSMAAFLTGGALREKPLQNVRGSQIAFTEDGRLAARAADGTVTVWETGEWSKQGEFSVSDSDVRAMAWHPSAEWLAVCCADGSVRVVAASDGSVHRIIQGTRPPYPFAAFSPDGNLLVASRSSRCLTLLQLETGNESTLELTEHAGPVACASFSPQGDLLATGAADSSVVLWSTSTWASWRFASGPTGPVRCLDFSPEGDLLATGGEDDVILVYEVDTGRRHRCFLGHHDDLLALAFAPGGSLLASLSSDAEVKLWKLEGDSGATRETGPVCLERSREVVWALGITPDGKYLVAGDDSLAVTVWQLDLEDGIRPAARFGPFETEFRTGTISRDGLFIVAVRNDHAQIVWRLAEGPRGPFLVQEAELPPGPSGIHSLALAPRGSLLACSDGDSRVTVYRRRLEGESPSWSRELRFALPEGFTEGDETEMSFSRREGLLAIASRSTPTVLLYDPIRHRPLHVLRGHRGRARCIAFSEDGTLLATGNHAGTANVWWLGEAGATRSPALLATLEGHGRTVQDLAFSPDGRRLVTAGEDWTLELWDLALVPGETTGIPCFTLRGHGRPLTCVIFGPDGRKLVSAAGTTGILGEVFLWRGASDEDVERTR